MLQIYREYHELGSLSGLPGYRNVAGKIIISVVRKLRAADVNIVGFIAGRRPDRCKAGYLGS